MNSVRQSIRSGLRRVALDALAFRDGATGALARSLARPRVHFLYFHDVEPERLTKFRDLLAFCAGHGTFVSYTDAVARWQAGTVDRPLYNISFDDGFATCMPASRVMDEFGASGCFFVNASIIGAGDTEAAHAFSRDRIRTRPTAFMSWADLQDLLRRGHEIGNHTFRHTNLGAPDFPLAEEIGHNREEIIRRLGKCDHFAWPFGLFRNFSAAARQSVFESGHLTCASAIRGAHVVPPKSLPETCIRREHLFMRWPTSHLHYFIARSARAASEADNRWPPEFDCPTAS